MAGQLDAWKESKRKGEGGIGGRRKVDSGFEKLAI
jgi:hypothetical protein